MIPKFHALCVSQEVQVQVPMTILWSKRFLDPLCLTQSLRISLSSMKQSESVKQESLHPRHLFTTLMSLMEIDSVPQFLQNALYTRVKQQQ